MMKVDSNLFIDILTILPDELVCYIQAPSLENTNIVKMLRDSDLYYYKLLYINTINKQEIVNQEITNPFSAFIQNIRINVGKSMLFEGFDGVEYGTLSKKLIIPEWFKKKYIPDTCMVSQEW